VDVRGHKITIKLITDNFSEHEPLFRAVYTALNEKHPKVFEEAIKQLKTLDAVLASAFEYEKKEFEAKEPNSYFVHAVIDKKPVGFLSFAVQPDGLVLMRNLAVDPAYQGMGIGKQLTNTIFDIKPKVTKITLLVHRANLTAIDMYKHLGFYEIPITPQKEFKPDPKDWMELEFTKK